MSTKSKLFPILLMAVIITVGYFTPVAAQDEVRTSRASVSLGDCTPGQAGSPSSTAVHLNIKYAKLSINGSDYTSSTTIYLGPGSYDWTWISKWGAKFGSGGGTLIVEDCNPAPTPIPGSASVSLGECVPGQTGSPSTTAVIISTSNATVTINGNSYTSTTIYLGPGSYDWTWTADPGYSGSGSGTLVVDDCTPKLTADAQVSVGACSYGEGGFTREVTLTIDGATVTITGPSGVVGAYSSSQQIALPVGSYTYTWLATASGYEGSGAGSFEIAACDPSKASANFEIGVCEDAEGGKVKQINIWVENAIFTIDGQQYTEPTTIKLPAGDYAYSWEPISGEFTGSGEGVISVEVCDPKISVDPQPDVAAGGVGPSLIGSLAPLVLGISGIGALSAIVATNKKKRDQ